jgi:hypothetical protein
MQAVTAVPVNASCFADSLEFLSMFHYVFHVKYVHELTLIYGLLEKIMGLKSSVGKSTWLAEFCREIGC